MGYDGLFLGRIDFQDKNKRLTDREMEMIFKASDSLGSKADLFTGILYNTYSPPSGFCFDILCNDEPVIDDEKSPEFNADKKVSEKQLSLPVYSIIMQDFSFESESYESMMCWYDFLFIYNYSASCAIMLD